MTVEVKKVSEDQLKTLRELTESWNVLNGKYGEFSVQLRVVKKAIDKIETYLDEVEKHRSSIVDEIQTQFGSTGVVDLKDGTFTPDLT